MNKRISLFAPFFSPEVNTIGFAMYYYTYDPWVGKTLHLEDFYISEDYQGKTTISSIYKHLKVSKFHFNIKTIDRILRYSDN